MDWVSVGKRIRESRLQKSWRQEDLGEAVGLSVKHIGALERGERHPNLESFIRIANALEIPADILLQDVTDKGYQVRMSEYLNRIDTLSGERRKLALKLLEVILDE